MWMGMLVRAESVSATRTSWPTPSKVRPSKWMREGSERIDSGSWDSLLEARVDFWLGLGEQDVCLGL